FANGAIDLAEAEGLADLLESETDLQRQAALASAGGRLSRQIEEWRDQVLALSAQVEAALDFSDEDDVPNLPASFAEGWERLAKELGEWLARPRAEKLREGFRVVLAGPPNAGKSSLFNALVESEAAITAPTAGTTRDVLERSVALCGVPFTFVDTAGLHEGSGDPIEAIGIARARAEFARADLVLWLGPEGAGPPGAWEVSTKSDRADFTAKAAALAVVSSETGEGLGALKRALMATARAAMPRPGEVALNQRQHRLLVQAAEALSGEKRDLLLAAERLRITRAAFDRLIGRASTEDMLDALFGRFCIGK
ncbi:MAG: tRNA modification GTPase, partial [Tsuneonella sp.]